MRGRVIYTDTIVSVWLRLAKNNGLDEEVYGMIANGGDDGDVSRHSSPSFGICDISYGQRIKNFSSPLTRMRMNF
jgi:hypothetical protein